MQIFKSLRPLHGRHKHDIRLAGRKRFDVFKEIGVVTGDEGKLQAADLKDCRRAFFKRIRVIHFVFNRFTQNKLLFPVVPCNFTGGQKDPRCIPFFAADAGTVTESHNGFAAPGGGNGGLFQLFAPGF